MTGARAARHRAVFRFDLAGRSGCSILCKPARGRQAQGTTTWTTVRRARANRSQSRRRAIDLGNEPPLVGRWRHRRPRRSPPRFGPVVFRHDSDRPVRRGADGRRRFHVARRRDQFRRAARARRERAARRDRRDRRQARGNAQERPAAAAGEANAARQVIRVSHHHARSATARSCACAPLCACPRNLSLTRIGILRQRAAVQSRRSLLARWPAPTAAAPTTQPRRRARRRSLLRDARSRRRAAAGQDRAGAADRRRDRARARRRRTGPAASQQPLPGRPACRRRRAPLAYAAEGTPDPYAGFEARIVPENITLLPKTANQTTGGNAWNERIVTVKKGETHRHRSCAISAPRPTTSARSPRCSARAAATAASRKARSCASCLAADGGQRLQPVRVIVAGDSAVEAVVALSDTGKYVAVDVASMQHRGRRGRRRRREDDGKRRAALSEHLRDRAAQPTFRAR